MVDGTGKRCKHSYLNELLMMRVVRTIKGRQNSCVLPRLFNVFAKQRSQLTHECNDFFVARASGCEAAQLAYSIFTGGGHQDESEWPEAEWHKALKRFIIGNNLGERAMHRRLLSSSYVMGCIPIFQSSESSFGRMPNRLSFSSSIWLSCLASSNTLSGSCSLAI